MKNSVTTYILYLYSLGRLLGGWILHIFLRFRYTITGYIILIVSLFYILSIPLNTLGKKSQVQANTFTYPEVVAQTTSTEVPNQSTITPTSNVAEPKQVEIKEVNPIDLNFSIVIPKIKVNQKVLENIDPFKAKEYSKTLENAVAHAKGTSLPFAQENTFLFAHSTTAEDLPYVDNAFFNDLGDLNFGDKIYVVYKNQVKEYKVTQKIVIEPSNTSYLTKKYGKEVITLMSCWPKGDDSQRLIVIAE